MEKIIKLKFSGGKNNEFLRQLTKILFIMKCFFIMLFLSTNTVYATLAYAQKTVLLIEMENKAVSEVLDEIERQSEFRFYYNGRIVDTDRKVTVHAQKASVFDVLEQLFKDSQVGYKVVDKDVILMERDASNNAPVLQGISITGKVTDSNGDPLPGVSVMVKGTSRGTATDANGAYTLPVPDENATLLFSFIGFISQEVVVGNKRTVNVTLNDDFLQLEEVVVVGYGTQKKINLTGAVDVISSERLSNRQAATMSQLLQGVAPGFNFSIENQGGFQPGANMNMTIRGMGSLNGGNPYILIDGFPGDINNLNPEDVESISVLKDAAASAIYGARAPYGVVLVTTKRAKKSEKVNVTYSGNIMINSPQNLPTALDSYTWTRVQNEAGNNMGGRPFPDEQLDRIIAYQNKDWNYLRQSMPYWPDGATVFGAFPTAQNLWDNDRNYANTDWWDVYFGNSVSQKHNLNIQGGTNKASYYFSAGVMDQNSVLQYGKDNFSRINVSGKVDLSITDWWDFSWETRFAKKKRELPHMTNEPGEESVYSFIFGHISRSYPFTPLYDGWGNKLFESHIPSLEASTDRTDELDTWNNFKMELRPLKGWKINADFAYNNYSSQFIGGTRHVVEYLVDQTFRYNGVSDPNNILRRDAQNSYWTTNLYTSFTFDIKDSHNFLLLAGMQLEKGNNLWLRGYKTNLLVESVPSLQTAVGSPVLSEGRSHRATEGYFARFAYNYKERYLFESNIRYDGSYVFREGNRWGFFPSFSVGWNVHREAFWESLSDYVNVLRLKGSWGQLGNQNVNPYTDIELIPMESGTLNWIFNYGQPRSTGYTSAPGIANRNLTWETVTTTNIGVDMSFLKNKLQVAFDWFERNTSDMVGPSEARPGVLGVGVPNSNNANLQTRGWELSVNWKQAFGNGFSYFVSANLNDYTSIVTKYNNPTGTLSTWYKGREVGEMWGYQVNDLFRSQAEVDEYRSRVDLSFLAANWRPGDVRYEDTNGDGKVNNGRNTLEDHGDLSIIGNSEPHYMYGFTVGANYKGIDFSMLWRGVAKKDAYFYNSSNLYWGFMNGWWETCLTPSRMDYFRDQPGTKYYGLHEGDANINTDAWWPRPYLNGTENAKNKNNINTRYMTSAAYLRLQNVQLGYTLPKALIAKLYLNNLRVYVSGENLITFTKLPAGMDPVAPFGYNRGGSTNGTVAGQNSSGSGRLTYGADRIYSFGVTITY